MTDKNSTAKPGKQMVYALSKPARCYRCDTKLERGEIVKLERNDEDKEVLCRKCAGLEGLEVLPKGDAKLTRLASKYSTTQFVIMQWSQLWKSYERVGMLVEAQALAKAKAEAIKELL
jgi:hypothetical protein